MEGEVTLISGGQMLLIILAAMAIGYVIGRMRAPKEDEDE